MKVALVGLGMPSRVSGAEALKVHRFIDALLQAPRSGG